jgi:predicted naringenin-chalcone synthase
MPLAILGIGTAVPPTTISQETAEDIARVLCCRSPEDETWLASIYQHAGIGCRHLVLGSRIIRDILDGTRGSESVFLPDVEKPDGPSTAERVEVYSQEAPFLAWEACRRALDRAGVEAGGITHLVTVSCTGFAAPGVDIDLIRTLGLPATTQRSHVGYMGCHGAMNGLRVARGLAAAEPGARVLLCAIELCSIHYSYGWDPQRMVGNALFADGSAALVGVEDSAGENAPWRLVQSGSCLVPDSEDAMSWTISDHGFVMSLSKNIPRLIATHLRPWLESWLARQDLTLDAVKSWAVHPGGPRILDAVEESLGLDPNKLAGSREVLAKHGNMSSPTILFILDRLMTRGTPAPLVALAFGPGLTVEAALLIADCGLRIAD